MKKKLGRPTDYKPEYCQQLIDHMARGMSFESFAGVVEVAESTINLWQKAHQDFSEAHQVGHSKMRAFWEDLGIVGTTEGNHFNASSWTFNMKNKLKWTDRTDLTTDGEKLQGPIVYIPKEEE